VVETKMVDTDLRYKDVETALASIYSIVEDELAGFRARLRNFRNLGIPDLPKLGSGTHLSYTRDHLYQMFLALELHTLAPPGPVAAFITENWKKLSGTLRKAAVDGRDCVLVVGGTNSSDDNSKLYLMATAWLDKANRHGLERMLFGDTKRDNPLLMVYLGSRLKQLERALGDALVYRRMEERAARRGS